MFGLVLVVLFSVCQRVFNFFCKNKNCSTLARYSKSASPVTLAEPGALAGHGVYEYYVDMV